MGSRRLLSIGREENKIGYVLTRIMQGQKVYVARYGIPYPMRYTTFLSEAFIVKDKSHAENLKRSNEEVEEIPSPQGGKGE